MLTKTPTATLPSTAELLLTGGDTRIVPDAVSGRTVYGCRPVPDPDLIALGSSTASVISENGMAAAEALRSACIAGLTQQTPHQVYDFHAARLRAELLAQCGFTVQDDVNIILSASGTDLHLLLAQWLRPQRTVMITATETGSGVAAAMQGKHFNACSAVGGEVPLGGLVSDWQGELCSLAIRNPDGSLRDKQELDAEYSARVNEAASAGQQALLILTDVSKTGLIVPGITTVLALKQRWKDKVDVLIDACQFRLSRASLRAYLEHGCMVAVTGSKFMCGPTFSGALLIPPGIAQRYQHRKLHAGAENYTDISNWPPSWSVAQSLPQAVNFGLLLRWEAALAELKPFFALPEQQVAAYLQTFAQAVQSRIANDSAFAALPVAALDRSSLLNTPSWDQHPSIFPFLLYAPDGQGGRRLVSRAETETLYKQLRDGIAGDQPTPRRYQLGQPVMCGERDGIPISALRLCVGAPMVIKACRSAAAAQQTLDDAMTAWDQLRQLLGWPGN